MEAIISLVLPYIAPSALPLIVVILGIAYIQSKRKETKNERDKDSQEIHDKLLEHGFQITNLKGELTHQKDVNEDLAKQIVELSKAVATFSSSVETLKEIVKDLKEDVKSIRNK